MATDSKKQRVLVVDDETRLCDIIGFYLQNAGYDTAFAHSGNEARKLLEQSSFDAVITDIRMPGGTGIELLDWVKTHTPLKPVVLFMTAHSDISIEEAYHKGAEVLLSKPVKPAILLSSLQKSLERNRAQAGRRTERVRINLTVDLLFGDGSKAFSARAFNLGRGGAFVAMDTETLPKIGEMLGFRINLAYDVHRKIEGKAIVRWCRNESLPEGLPIGIGVEFMDLSALDQETLVETIASAKERTFIPRS